MRSHAAARPVQALTVLMALLASLFIAMGAAHALPPGGASANTPGTSSSVNPGSVRAGDYLNFTLSGFPAGSTVSVKFDDGSTCPADAPQGACVVHQQVVPSSGTLKGSFQVPKDIKKGSHTLRFLAAAYVDANDKAKGSNGYSNKSPQFQVTGVNQDAKSSGSVSGQQVKPGTSGGNSGSGQGGSDHGSNGSGNGGNGGSGANGSGNGSSGHNESGGSDRSNTDSGAAASGSGGKKIQYVDENGNPISEEEAKRLQNEGKGGSVKEEVVEEDTASAAPSATATTRSSASATSETKDRADSASSAEDSGSDVPWIGIVAIVLVLVVAVVVILRRRAAGRADGSDQGSGD